MFDYQEKPSVDLSLEESKDLYVNEMMMFSANFKVLNVVTRKRRREQEKIQNTEQDDQKALEDMSQEQCLEVQDEVPSSELEKTTSLTKLFPKDEDEDEWRTCYIEYMSNQM